MKRPESRRQSFCAQCLFPTCLYLSSPWELRAPALRQPGFRLKISHGKNKNQTKKHARSLGKWPCYFLSFFFFFIVCKGEEKIPLFCSQSPRYNAGLLFKILP